MRRSKIRKSKLMTLDDAISTYVQDGDLVGFGGLSFWRKPIEASREIIRQEKKDLSLCTFIGGIEIDMLVAAGCASKVRSSFVGMEIFGMAPNYRKAVESRSIKISEESEASIALGLRASYLKVPFMPLKGIIGTDMSKVRNDIKQFKDPLGSDTELMALPKIDLDVAILHVPYADEYGNGNIAGAVWIDDDMAKRIGNVDILFIPVGGIFTIDGNEAIEVCKKIKPKVVVPMHYKVGGLSLPIERVDSFLSNAREYYDIRHVANEIEIERDDLPEESEVWVFTL